MSGTLLAAILAFAVTILSGSAGMAVASVAPARVAQTDASPSPSPAPTASATETPDPHGLPCATNSDEVAFSAALATPVDQISVLAFIGRLRSLQPRAQRTLFDAVAAAAHDDPSAEGRVFAFCAPVASIAATERALIEITNLWSLDELSNASKFTDFARGLRAAIAARMLGDLVPEQLRASVFAPFVAQDPQMFAVPDDPSSGGACRGGSAPASAFDVYHPPYPSAARDQSATGIVKVRVDLDRFGFVTALQIVNSTAPKNSGGDALEKMSLLAAAATSYRPECSGESPAAGSYVFQADYTARP